MAAIGFRVHTGWAACVVLEGQPGRLKVLLRRRLELLPKNDSPPRFLFHSAAELGPDKAADLVESARLAVHQHVRLALQELLQTTPAIECAGIPVGSKEVPQKLAAILASHPLIHSAEGAFYQQAVADACTHHNLPVFTAREKAVWLECAPKMQEELTALRTSVGPPWGEDQRIAAAAALFALKSYSIAG